MKYLLIVILSILVCSSLQEVLIDGNEQCVQCLSQYHKVCRNGVESPKTYCCDYLEESPNCGQAPHSICSTEIDEDNQFLGKYLICGNHPDCGPSSHLVNAREESEISLKNIPGNATCLIEVQNYGCRDGVKFTETKTDNTDVLVYQKSNTSDSRFSYQDRMYEYDLDFDVEITNSLYLLVAPLNGDSGWFNVFAGSSCSKLFAKNLPTNLNHNVILGFVGLSIFLAVYGVFC